MTKTFIRFLKDYSCPVGQLVYCGDGCCSWFDYESEPFKAGQEVEEDNYHPIELNGLEENVDYEFFEQ